MPVPAAGGKTLAPGCTHAEQGHDHRARYPQVRLDELRRRATRNAADNIKVQVIDDPKVIKRLHDTADRVLLDVPCSGLGVIRRNPDTKWKLKSEETKSTSGNPGRPASPLLEDYQGRRQTRLSPRAQSSRARTRGKFARS
jgi:16S rRNA C967 or C1407 C5-methylase (RsmB/RsmF family)